MGGVFIYRGVGSNFGKNGDYLYKFKCMQDSVDVESQLRGWRGGGCYVIT